MSETVHYRGKATKLADQYLTALGIAQKILKERNKEIDSDYDDEVQQLVDEFSEEYFYYAKTDSLYHISSEKIDADDEIIKAKYNFDSTIDYELRYYNGGAGFEECLEEAFDKMYSAEKI